MVVKEDKIKMRLKWIRGFSVFFVGIGGVKYHGNVVFLGSVDFGFMVENFWFVVRPYQFMAGCWSAGTENVGDGIHPAFVPCYMGSVGMTGKKKKWQRSWCIGKCIFEMIDQLSWIKKLEKEGDDDDIYDGDGGNEIIVKNK